MRCLITVCWGGGQLEFVGFSFYFHNIGAIYWTLFLLKYNILVFFTLLWTLCVKDEIKYNIFYSTLSSTPKISFHAFISRSAESNISLTSSKKTSFKFKTWKALRLPLTQLACVRLHSQTCTCFLSVVVSQSASALLLLRGQSYVWTCEDPPTASSHHAWLHFYLKCHSTIALKLALLLQTSSILTRTKDSQTLNRTTLWSSVLKYERLKVCGVFHVFYRRHFQNPQSSERRISKWKNKEEHTNVGYKRESHYTRNDAHCQCATVPAHIYLFIRKDKICA